MTITNCPCCNEPREADEYMLDHWGEPMRRAAIKRYGREVCTDCADTSTLCDVCGDFITKDETYIDAESGLAECYGHIGEIAAQFKADRDHMRLEVMGL